MNKLDIISTIENPELLNNLTADEWKSLCDKYPYAGIFQSAYAKVLNDSQDILFEEQLKNAAITNANRKKLYELIHQTKLRNLIEKIETETFSTEKTEQNLPLTTNTITNINFTDNQGKAEEEVKLDKIRTIDELEKNILAHAISSSIQLEVPETTVEDESSQKQNTEEVEALEMEETPKDSFSSWFTKDTENKKIKKPIHKKKDTSSIIDSFLRKDKTKPFKQPMFSPENLAKMSLVEKEDFVTETLAEIYSKQGHFDKAIKIYERLILNYPEKNTFFASRIRFLKEKIENQTE